MVKRLTLVSGVYNLLYIAWLLFTIKVQGLIDLIDIFFAIVGLILFLWATIVEK